MKLKNIHLYNYVVIYTKNCDLYVKKIMSKFIFHKKLLQF